MKKGDKIGQFYFLTTIIIITLIAGFVTLLNYTQEKSDVKFYYLGEELGIESENILDYGINNNKDLKELLENFTKTYSDYSEAENLYFIFGNKEIITVSGYQELESGTILIDVGSGNQELILNKGEYNSKDFPNPQNNVKVTVDEIEYDFTLRPGENFYFIISKEIEEEEYVGTNS